MDKPYLNLAGLAQAVNLPRDWLRDQARAGRIPCLRVGRRMLFNLGAVQAALGDMAAKSRCNGQPGAGEVAHAS